jgi:hypothetical protein
VNFNINARVRVTLTQSGVETLRRTHSGSYEVAKVWEAELWRVMQVFGPSLYTGMAEMPFVRNELDILEIQ